MSTSKLCPVALSSTCRMYTWYQYIIDIIYNYGVCTDVRFETGPRGALQQVRGYYVILSYWFNLHNNVIYAHVHLLKHLRAFDIISYCIHQYYVIVRLHRSCAPWRWYMLLLLWLYYYYYYYYYYYIIIIIIIIIIIDSSASIKFSWCAWGRRAAHEQHIVILYIICMLYIHILHILYVTN